MSFCVILIGAGPSAAGSTVSVTADLDLRQGDCQVHVVEEGGVEKVVRCGQPVQTSGRHSVAWVETATLMTPFLTAVPVGEEIRVGGLVASGAVVFPAERSLGRGERLRLLSLLPPEDGTRLRSFYIRDVTSLAMKPRLPAGQAVAMLIDEKDRPIAVSVFTVRPGKESVVWPEAPGAKGNVVVAWLARPRPAEHPDQDEVAIIATDEAGEHRPRAFVNSRDALFALWDDLSGPRARFVIESRDLRLPSDSVEVHRRVVTSLVESLVVLPTLRVAIGGLPEDLPVSVPMSLAISTAAQETTTIRRLAVQEGRSYKFESMPAALLTLHLRLEDFVIEKRADLTSGNDVTIEIPLIPLEISGTVFRAGEPIRARLRFLQGRDEAVSVETDFAGAFEVTLWQPGRYIVETVPGDRPTMPPFTQAPAIVASRSLDVHIPENSLSARVYDTADGKPVEGARITVHNRWEDLSGFSSRVATFDVQGEFTELPPMRSGTAELSAYAPGYRRDDPFQVMIPEGAGARIIDLPMTRQTNAGDVEIRLADTSPAAGAEVAAWTDGELVWFDTADSQGKIPLPTGLVGRVILRHPAAASLVVLSLEPGASIALEPVAAPLPIRITARNNGSVSEMAGIRLTLWLLGGVRLSGPESAFATWSSELPLSDGFFILKGLGRRPLKILVTRRVPVAQIRAGAFDARATTLPYPPPAVGIVEIVDP